jgi:NodT family efflux transporter outer membrane factor (OMF) lipoprotein
MAPLMRHRFSKWAVVAALGLAATGCTVGPRYAKPSAPVPPAFKEPPPAEFKEANQFKTGEPRDDTLRGKWWEVFGDPQLNALEEQVLVSNQNIAQADAQFRQARAAILITRSGLFPTVTAGGSASRSHTSSNRGVSRGFTVGSTNDFQIPLASAAWEPDIWGSVRRTIEANIAGAQVSAADLENVRLSMQAELAGDYFQLHGLDGEKQLLDTTVVAYRKALDLTNDRHAQGIASGVDVAQAQTQLETTLTQSIDLEVVRAQMEHAIAVLTGKPPAELTIPIAPINVPPPAVPIALPSELLERRPDVASAERQMAAANAQIGVAQAAYYPTISLTASAGLEASSLLTLLNWPSRLWAIGASLSETVFDAGKRKATTDQARAAYDAAVAAYRLSVLSAFQDVEDNLSSLRILSEESQQQAATVKTAERLLELANNRYRGGITTYLEVITAQSAALAAEQAQVELQTRRMTTSVLLVKALGGGWNVSSLPSAASLATK